MGTALNADEERTEVMRAEVSALAEASYDALSPTAALEMAVNQRWAGVSSENDRVLINAHTKEGDMPIRVLEGAHEQIAFKTGIPYKYYKRMLNSEPELLARNVNTWFQLENETRLLRMFQPITEEDATMHRQLGTRLSLRAVLSDRYRPLDHLALLDTLLPVVRAVGGRVAEYNLDEKRFHVRFVTTEVDVKELAEQYKRDHPDLPDHFIGLNEIVSFGVAVRNSETGHAALAVQPLVKIMRCVNLLVVVERHRVTHLGGRQEAEEDFLTAGTKRLDDAAVFMKVRDTVQNIFSDESRNKTLRVIAESQGTPIDLPPEVPLMKFIEGVGRKFDLSEGEIEILQDEFVKENVATGQQTQWSLSQAFTATARRLNDESNVGFQRKQEIEEVGWKVLVNPVTKLIVEASKN